MSVDFFDTWLQYMSRYEVIGEMIWLYDRKDYMIGCIPTKHLKLVEERIKNEKTV